MRRIWPLLLVLLSGCLALRAFFPADRPPFVPAEAVYVSGPYSRAITTAYDDYLAQMAADLAESERIDESEDAGAGIDVVPAEVRALNKCLNRPEAHQTWVHLGDGGTTYIVDILPKPEFCLGEQANQLIGGGAIYEIDAQTFEILKKEIQE